MTPSANPASARPGGTVDPAEVDRFEGFAADWWDPHGPMAPLHRLNPVRIAYIRNAVARRLGRDPAAPRPLRGLTLLDVGCGGGLLCEPMARLGAEVTGIDPAAGNAAAAAAHASAGGLAIDYHARPVEAVAASGETFDVVTAMEVIEHVASPSAFLAAVAACVAPGGIAFLATINRTARSWALAIVGAEYVLGWLPRGTHRWSRFLRPSETAGGLHRAGLAVEDITGVSWDPLTGDWRTGRDVSVNYMLHAVRQRPA